MTPADHDRQIDYVEFGATDIGRTKQFYQQAFGWRFEDYGPDYTSFQDGGEDRYRYRARAAANGTSFLCRSSHNVSRTQRKLSQSVSVGTCRSAGWSSSACCSR